MIERCCCGALDCPECRPESHQYYTEGCEDCQQLFVDCECDRGEDDRDEA